MVIKNNVEPLNATERKLWVLLNTIKGTVPLYRDFGISHKIIDSKITDIPSILFGDLDQQIKKYIEELKLVNIKCEKNEEQIIILVEVKENEAYR